MDEHVIRTYVRAEPRFVAGCGAELVDEHGAIYLDFLGGIAVNALGHAHPRLVAALREQAGKLLHVSNLFRHEHTEPVAAKLAKLTGLEATFFANSGAEANEGALKLARKFQRARGATERTGFVALEGGFHGRTMGALSVTAYAPYREPFAPLIPGVQFVKANDLGALESAFAEGHGPAALILEPIQGEGGVRALEPDYLRGARALCTATETVLIHDEVQCGTGRTGKFLCADHVGVKPDVVTLAKPLAAGLPMGVFVASQKFAQVLAPGDHGTTFGGGPFVTCAARVLLEELDEGGLLGAVAERGEQLHAGLAAIARRHAIVTEVRGRGLMAGLRLARDAAALQKKLFAERLITNCTAGDVLRLLPPYVVTAEQIEHALDRIDSAIAEL